MQLVRFWFSSLDRETQLRFCSYLNEIVEVGSSNYLADIMNAWKDYSSNILDAKIVYSVEEDMLIDYCVYDPFGRLVGDVVGYDGCTDYLLCFVDGEGDNVSRIFAEKGGIAVMDIE